MNFTSKYKMNLSASHIVACTWNDRLATLLHSGGVIMLAKTAPARRPGSCSCEDCRQASSASVAVIINPTKSWNKGDIVANDFRVVKVDKDGDVWVTLEHSTEILLNNDLDFEYPALQGLGKRIHVVEGSSGTSHAHVKALGIEIHALSRGTLSDINRAWIKTVRKMQETMMSYVELDKPAEWRTLMNPNTKVYDIWGDTYRTWGYLTNLPMLEIGEGVFLVPVAETVVPVEVPRPFTRAYRPEDGDSLIIELPT